MRQVITVFALFALSILTGCAEAQLGAHVAKQVTRPEPTKTQNSFKVGSSYKVDGKVYQPQETYSFTETGIASWYGPGFHGKRTANGEVFDKNELTAAHRTLQMPSLIRVTNLDNGRSVILRVNDRGPFSKSRVLDVSQKGAELLAFKNIGTARVKIQLLEEESRKVAELAKRGVDTRGYEVALNQNRVPASYNAIVPAAGQGSPATTSAPQAYQTASVTSVQAQALPPVANVQGHISADGRFMPDPVVEQQAVSNTNLYVQAGSFSVENNALTLARKLESIGPSQVSVTQVRDQQFYRVRIGPFSNTQQADTALKNIISNGTPDAKIIVE